MTPRSNSQRPNGSSPKLVRKNAAGAGKIDPLHDSGDPSRRRSALLTRQRILAAATDEFAANGFSGARTARIAHRARINRAMLHYYFGSKHALFEQVLRLAAEQTIREANWNGDDPIGSLVGCIDVLMRDPRRMRLLQWESLQGATIGVQAPLGSEHFQSLVGVFQDDVQQQLHKALIVVSAAFGALAFPRSAESAIGQSVNDPNFAVVHRRLIRRVADCLRRKG